MTLFEFAEVCTDEIADDVDIAKIGYELREERVIEHFGPGSFGVGVHRDHPKGDHGNSGG